MAGPADSAIGDRLGKWHLEAELGRGGMGAVYVASHSLIGKQAAIKVVLPAHADPELLSRFFQEAKAAAQLHHAGIVEVFDYGVDGDRAYLVMELLEGESLGARLRREQRLPVPLALEVARQVASAVGAAHAKGIVHRDLKPDNLMLVPDPALTCGVRVKVVDFGVAKLVTDEVPVVTAPGSVVGTPIYMSPEQCRGAGGVGPRTDVYALGVILYQMVAGVPPFVRQGVGEVLSAHIADPVPRIPGAPPDVENLVLQMLLKDPAARMPSMEAVERAIDALAGQAAPADPLGETTSVGAQALETEPPARPRRTRLAVAVGIAAVLAGGLFWLWPRPRADPATPLRARADDEAAARKLAALVRADCEAGAARACVELGSLLARGIGTARDFDRAFSLAMDACDRGEADGCAAAARLLFVGNGAKRDQPRAVALFDKACAAGSGLGCVGLGEARKRGAGGPLDVAAAHAAFQRGCAADFAAACLEAGADHLFGTGTARDPAAADKIFARAGALARSSCDAGEGEGCQALGMIHFRGLGSPVDPGRAFTALKRGCDLGFSPACSDVGQLYLAGHGPARDEKKGIEILERACAAGEPRGCQELGLAYAFGRNAPLDTARGRQILSRECDRGDDGCVGLAFVYARGAGVPQDPARALDLFGRACNAGDLNGCISLGTRLRKGQGLPVDRSLAKRLFSKACEGGYENGCDFAGEIAYEDGRDDEARSLYQRACDVSGGTSCARLGSLYLEGRGVARDTQKGTDLYLDSCKRGSNFACNELARRMLAGKDLQKNPLRARELFEGACRDGWVAACAPAAQLYAGEEALVADPAREKAMRERGCELGDKTVCR